MAEEPFAAGWLDRWIEAAAPLLWGALLLGICYSVAIAWTVESPDFDVFVASARAWWQGADPYQGFFGEGRGINLNPPLAVMAFAPIAWLPGKTGLAVWLLLNAAAVCWTASIILRQTNVPLLATALIGYSSLTGLLALQLGQLSAVLCPLVTLAWLADRSNRGTRAAILVGLLVYLKPFFALFIIYWLWRKKWRSSLVASGVVVMMMAVTFVVWPSFTLEWIEALRVVRWQGLALNGSVEGLAHRMFGPPIAGARPLLAPFVVSSIVEQIATLAGWTIVVTLSWRALRRVSSVDREWSVVGMGALLLSPLGWSYYLGMFAVPLAATLPLSVVIVPLLFLNVPSATLASAQFSALGSATAGSVVFWSFLLLWIQSMRAAHGPRVIAPPARH